MRNFSHMRQRGIAFRLALAGALIWALTVAETGLLAAETTADFRGHVSIWNSREKPSPRIALFPKWSGTLNRYFDERKLGDGDCESSFFNRCHLREWSKFLDSIRNRDRVTQVHEVNRYMNRVRYIVDPRNYGVRDYWATPKEFLSRDDDCEDYAIAKYLSLRALGFPPSQLRVVILQDLNLKLAHAILVVSLSDRALVLDNQIRTVVNARAIHHYKPIYSINEEFWWLHKS
jgi:predicted transglutaminase-like cysteine proteinase